MQNNCLSVLYKHIIQVENKNAGLKVWGGRGTNIPLPPPQSKKWGAHAPLAPPPPPASYASAYSPCIMNIMSTPIHLLTKLHCNS